ncbi:MAG: MAPEG family protein [Litoreibacter sp.]
MTSLFEAVPYLVAYQFSFLVLAILALIALVQSFLNAPLAFGGNSQTPGMPLQYDHTHVSFRVVRTYANTVENLPALGFALLMAIVAGASPWAINLLAGIHLVFRVLFWGIYYSGIGKVTGGPRTLAYVGGALANIVIAGMAIFALM